MTSGLIMGIVTIYVLLLMILYVMKSLTGSMFITVTIMYIMAVWVLRVTNIIGAGTGTKIAAQDKKKYADERKKTELTMWVLKNLEQATKTIGFPPSDSALFEWDFLITRITKPIACINRRIKAVELLGVFRIITFLIIFICIWVFIYTFSAPAVVVALAAVLIPGIAKSILQSLVNEQDRELERDFPDLYLLLYCALQGGVNSRIAPSLADYNRSMDALYAPTEHRVIRQFVLDLQNNIEVYADESEALVHMREKYKSALVVNFCNLATQSLRGVDTSEKLMAFKIELQAKQKDMMEKEARARVEMGRKATIAIYLILFEFIVLSWASKLF